MKRKAVIAIVIFVGVLAAASLLLSWLYPLPSQANRPADSAVVERDSPVERHAAVHTGANPGKSGLEILQTGMDAFATRLALARSASRSIDAQYYIWEGDLSGRMMLAELVAAADRGVRVRLLIDDNPTAGLDDMWAAANEHPNISVRIFNPLTIRKIRPANYLFDPLRLNRRMHNKSMTFDNQATVIGGRNVGDAYFGAKEDGMFIDLDVLAVGPVVADVSREFEEYWQSTPAYPAERILNPSNSLTIEQLRAPKYDDAALAAEYRAAAAAALEKRLKDADTTPLIWTDVRLVADNPEKALAKSAQSDLVVAQIAPLIEGAKQRFDLVSGYFVPGDLGSDLLEDLEKRKVEVRVVTNSVQVTDVPLVHAGYAPVRQRLLKGGVELYEVRPTGGEDKQVRDLGVTRFSGGGESVHAKTFTIDEKTVFIGSFNFDMRSALLNCEMGFVFDSPELAKAMNAELDKRLPVFAFQVKRDDAGDLTWTTIENGKTVVAKPEPGTTWVSRELIKFFGWLPIKWLL